MFRILLAAAIICGMNTSLCTGGILTIASELSRLTLAEGDSGPMSYGAVGYLSCASNTDDSSEDLSSAGSHCQDASLCFSQLSMSHTDRALLMHTASIASLVGVEPVFVHNIHPTHQIAVAREGPLYREAKNSAHTLLKRE